MMRKSAVFLLCFGLAASAGCDRTLPTTPTTGGGPTSVTQVFSSSLVPGETPSFPFTVPAPAPLHILFGSLTNAAGLPLGSAVTLKFGIVPASGTGCDALTKVTATAALTAQISVVASAGAYCTGLEDTTGVPVAANFAIRLIYGTPSDASDGQIVYNSTVLPTGFTARSFTASTGGVATVVMENIAPASVASLGLGLGFQRNDGSGCEVASTVVASRGTQFSVPVDAGRYCVKVFDLGTLTDTATFVLRIQRP